MVRLAANPSTGHRWSADSSAPAVLVQEGPPAHEGGLPIPGAGGEDAFTFRAAGPGAAHLSFEWRREPGRPAETFDLDVTVTP